jgi:hypothetical protein
MVSRCDGVFLDTDHISRRGSVNGLDPRSQIVSRKGAPQQGITPP